MNGLIFFFLPFSLSLLLTPLVKKLAFKIGLLAYPRPDRWHKNPTALLGGIGIYFSVLISLLLLRDIDSDILVLLSGGTVLFLAGIVDDKFKIKPYTKLFLQIIVGCIAILFGATIRLPGYELFSLPLTLLWIVGVTNSFNLLDNIDGLAAGIAGIASFTIFAYSYYFSQANPFATFALVLCGATLGFLPYNFNPAKIFMGDSGSMFIGYSLAVIAISGTRNISNLLLTIFIPVAILMVPIFDTIFVMAVRKIQKRNIFLGGKDHTSHRLVTLGLSVRKTVLLFYLLSTAFGLLALLSLKINSTTFLIIGFFAGVVLLFFGLFLFEGVSYKKPAALKESKAAGLILNSVFLYKRRIAEVLLDFMFICAAYYLAYALRFEGTALAKNIFLMKQSLPWLILIKMSIFFSLGLYRGLWKYISIPDFFTIFKAVSLGSVASVLFLTFVYRFKDYSRAVFFIDWLVLLFLITGSRFLFRMIGEFFIFLNVGAKKILIFGAGDTGEMLIREIKRNKELRYFAIGFIDDDPRKKGTSLQGIPVLGSRRQAKGLIERFEINEIIVAIPSLGLTDLAEISQLCSDCGITFRRVRRMLQEDEEGGVSEFGKN